MKTVTTHNKSLHWIFTPLRSIKTSEFSRYMNKNMNKDIEKIMQELAEGCDRIIANPNDIEKLQSQGGVGLTLRRIFWKMGLNEIIPELFPTIA